jgi:hypothetical protein
MTKEVFETFVPAAKMPDRNTSVYERLQSHFVAAYGMMVRTLVSPQFEAALDTDGRLRSLAIPLVCVDAFVRTCRSLDVVLTATGFGIVSTESTAPASKSRVDALVEEMALEELDLVDEMVQELMKVEGWGLTEQAQMRVHTLFYSPRQMRLTTMKMTTDNWHKAMGLAPAASAFLRNEISDEYMDELLLKLRTGSLGNADIIVVQKCVAFMADFISHHDTRDGAPNELLLRQIVHQLESFRDSYPTYTNSSLYARRHAERYKNKKEDPTFFFM